MTNKVWQADSRGVTHKCTKSVSEPETGSTKEPAKKVKVGNNGKAARNQSLPMANVHGKASAGANTGCATEKGVGAPNSLNAVRSATKLHAYPAPVNLDLASDSSSEDELPLNDVKNTRGLVAAKSTKEGQGAVLHQHQVQNVTHLRQVNSNAHHVDADVNASEDDSEDLYMEDEDKEEGASEDDDLEFAECDEDLQAQLVAEQPFWNEETENSVQRKDMQRADSEETKYVLPDDFYSEIDEAEEQEAAECLIALATTPASAAKAKVSSSSRSAVETPVWKATTIHPTPTAHSVALLGQAARMGQPVAERPTDKGEDEDDELAVEDTLPDEPDQDLPAHRYDIIRLQTAGAVLSLNVQHPHICSSIHRAFNTIERDLYFRHAFPDAIKCSRFIADALRDAAAHLGHDGLRQRFEQDVAFTRAIGTLPTQRISSFRSGIKNKSDSSVSAYYGLQKGHCKAKVEFLFDHLTYIYPHEYEKTQSVSWKKPYLHECVSEVLYLVFFKGPTSFAVRAQHQFTSSLCEHADEKEIPMAMLALVGTVIHASLNEWKSGTHKNMPFSADGYIDVYNEHIIVLDHICNNIPRAYHTLMHRLYKHVSGLVDTTESTSTNALERLDIDGMDVE